MSHHERNVAKLLSEAHANELALIQTLEAHVRIAPEGPYRDRLDSHIDETRNHAERVQRRLDQLGATRNPLEAGIAVAHSIITNMLAMAKAPIDMVRGAFNVEEKALKNARDEIVTEALEIAQYDAIEHMARAVGDDATARLAVEIRAEEEAMLDDLRAQIPSLVAGAVRANVPADEIVLDAVEPWPGYDDMTVDEIKERIASSPELARSVEAYERAHKNRVSIIRELQDA
ncbi:MAG: ferritin-like domain-containing protein [Actinomycetota bacterium]|nr:ferritin-like domain-containing protein [Actinomycetota bacterium]